MKLVQLLKIFASLMLLDARYTLYHSDDRQELKSTFDCLYAYLMEYIPDDDVPSTNNYHLTPHCRRLGRSENQEELLIRSNKQEENGIPFSQLYRPGVTSTQLLNWLALIDIAERYEKEGDNSMEVFYNCSSPWFGSMCQYTFDNDALPSFVEIIQSFFDNRPKPPWEQIPTIRPCYPFLAGCDRGIVSTCLDWREICDGNIDCINGEDEQFCQLLEITECSDNEFRCHYDGQCVTPAFVRDGVASTDCLDGTDESASKTKNLPFENHCSRTTTFRCEEQTRRYPERFSCGDGESKIRLIPHWDERCHNDRDLQMIVTMLTSLDHISDLSCQQAFYCLIRIDQIIFGEQTENSNRCEPLIDRCSSKWLVLPKHPVMFDFFQFVYLTNRSVDAFEADLMPDFICFNSSRCPALIFCTIDIGIRDGLICCRTNRLTNSTVQLWWQMGETLENAVQRCSLIGSEEKCSHPSLLHCSRSLKCVSKYRLVDGWRDCYFGEDEAFPACQLNDSSRFNCESQPNQCLSMIAVENGERNCPGGEDELNDYQSNILRGYVPFGLLCNGRYDFPPFKKIE